MSKNIDEELALMIVEKEFKDKKDKGGKPYVDHLKRVSKNSYFYYLELFRPEFASQELYREIRDVSLLHDLLEDCPHWTKEILSNYFPTNVVEAVDLLTKKKGVEYDEYIKNIKNNMYARVVKLADLEDNMNVSRLLEITDKDIKRIKKYHKSFKYLKGLKNE